MRLTLTTLRGGTVWDEEPPPETVDAIGRQIPANKPVALYEGEAASRVAGAILRDLLPLPPSPRLMVLMSHLQTIEHREKSRVVILR